MSDATINIGLIGFADLKLIEALEHLKSVAAKSLMHQLRGRACGRILSQPPVPGRGTPGGGKMSSA